MNEHLTSSLTVGSEHSSDTNGLKAIGRNPFDAVQQLSGFYFVSRALHAVAELGVADAIGDQAMPVRAVAQATGTDEDALGRLLRLLSSHRVFELQDGSVTHTAASELLRSDHPASLRDFARMFGLPLMWRITEGLPHSLRTGEAATPRMFPDGGFWGYLADHPEEARVFDAAMAAKARAQIGAILAAHDFSAYRSVADIGGGQGHLLRAVLETRPDLTGILFDLPHVVEATRNDDMQGRLTFRGGDFFKDAPPTCDAYVLMEVLHDWNDGPAREIIGAIRQAAAPHSKLLIVETVVPESPAPDWAKSLDIVMMTLFAGRQRTAEQYADLLRAGGFALQNETDTGAGISIFEAVPV